MRVYGLTERLNRNSLNSIFGFTDVETVKLDFDDTSFKTVRYWAFRTMRWFKLEGFVILKSSENCYHVVFNRSVCWSENMRIVGWVTLLSHKPKLEKWFVMQCIKQGSTLRVSTKKEKCSPRVVFRYGRQDKQIDGFLTYRRLIKRFVRRLETEYKMCEVLMET